MHDPEATHQAKMKLSCAHHRDVQTAEVALECTLLTKAQTPGVLMGLRVGLAVGCSNIHAHRYCKLNLDTAAKGSDAYPAVKPDFIIELRKRDIETYHSSPYSNVACNLHMHICGDTACLHIADWTTELPSRA